MDNRFQQDENQLHPEVLGAINTINPFIGNNSAARTNMDAAHISQMLVLPRSDPMRITSGIENEYGKYTFKVEVEHNCRVVKILNKYPKSAGNLNFKRNSETLIIVEKQKEDLNDPAVFLDVIEVTPFHNNHKFAGFQYVFTDAFKNLKEGDYLQAGTVLAHSPSIKDGNYCFGLEANVVAGSFHWVIEDGIAISDEFAQRAASKGFGERYAEWGKEYYPLNLYGDENNYKPFPDIGDRIREDGLVFALRKYNKYLSLPEMNAEALREPDHTFDKLIFGEPNALVENIHVWHSHVPEHNRTPAGMNTQAERYWRAIRLEEDKLLEFYQQQQAKLGKRLMMHERLSNKIRDGWLNDPANLTNDAVRTFRKEKLDDWRVSIEYSYDILPTLEYKLSDLSATEHLD